MCLAVTVAGTEHLDTQWQAPLGWGGDNKVGVFTVATTVFVAG